jgi:hypothetical protein
MTLTEINRQIFLTMTFDNNATMYQAAADISNAHLAPLANTPGLTWSLLFQPIPRLVTDNSIANGGNIMGLNRTSGNLIRKSFSITIITPKLISRSLLVVHHLGRSGIRYHPH